MRKPFIFALCLLWSVISIQAQITIESNTLPRVNDTLRTSVDPNPTVNFDAQPIENAKWVFNDLNSPTVVETIFRDPSEGSSQSFPTATAVTLSAQGPEFYYKIDDNTMLELGLFGQDPVAGLLEVDGVYAQPLTIRRTPLVYGSTFSQTSGLFFPIPLALVPDSLIQELPIQPDSLRLNISIQRQDNVDAWGTLEVNSRVYDVLRERREEIRQLGVEALLPFVGWQDVTPLIEGFLPGAGVGTPDTIVSYNFFNDQEREPIAVVNVDNEDNPVSIEYIAKEVTTSNPYRSASSLDVTASPNPGIGILEFRFSGAQADQYTIEVRNMVGQSLWDETVYIDGKGRLSANLTHLNRGTYFYTVYDSKGNPLLTQRVVFIRA